MKYADIGSVVSLAADLLQNSDHLERNIVQHDGGAHGLASVVEGFRQFDAEHGDAHPAVFVSVGNPAACLDRNRADVGVDRRHTEDLSVGTVVFADSADVFAIQNWGDALYQVRLVLDVEVVLISQLVGKHRLQAAFDGRYAAAEDKHDVLPDAGELFVLAGAKALAKSNQKQQRADSPRDSEHGEERAQFMRPQGAE